MASCHWKVVFLVCGIAVLSTARRSSANEKIEWTQPDKVLVDDFWCPTCQNTTQESCDAHRVDTSCPKANICMTLWDENVFTRKCINRKMLELLSKDCSNAGNMKRECKRRNREYHLSWCNQAGCKAEVFEISRRKSAVEKAARNEFWCPTCQSYSRESCDQTLTNTSCLKADYCMTLSDKNVFTRKCVNKRMLELFTKNCTKIGFDEWKCNRKRKYQVTACGQSGCMAEFSESFPVLDKPAGQDFWCPTCQSTSQESCDRTLTNTTCPKANHCMVLSDKNVFTRKCVNTKMIELLTKDCRNVESNQWECNRKRKYQVTTCDKPGCKAEFSKTSKSDPVVDKPTGQDFWCPTCQSHSRESCDETLTNTTCPKADHCMALSDKNIFTRKCVNTKMVELLTKDCRSVTSNEWECNRKRKYHVTACDQPGCKAEFSKSSKGDHDVEEPARNDFWCPTCQSTSQESCDQTLTNTTCPKADHCMALSDKNIFTRKCVNTKMIELLTKDCRSVGSSEWECNRELKYHVTACDQPGCKAEFSGKTSKGEPTVGKPAINDFWCPTCQSHSRESCDQTLTNTTCPKADHCMALSDKNIFTRKCVNTKMIELLTKDCRSVGSSEWECNRKRKYEVTACDQPGCKAEFSKTAKGDRATEEPARNDFWCPTCQSTSQESCDRTLTNTTCPKADHCMALSDKNIFTRKCVNTKMVELLTKDCRSVGSSEWECNRKRKYQITACNQPGCKAEFSKTAKGDRATEEPARNEFWCPTCQSTSQESCDRTLTNTTCPKADRCMALSDRNVFTRKCVNGKMIERLTEDCRSVGRDEWECNRKKTYHVSACDQSGCLAKMTSNVLPKENLFQCPTCPVCKSPKECDHKMTVTNCPMATRCMVLRFNSTVDTQSIFTRQCINEKTYMMIQRACTFKQGCEMTSCTHSGCKAAL